MIIGMRRITELAINRPDVYYPVRKNTKPFNRKYFLFPLCFHAHTHLKHKLCWKYTHLLRNVIQKQEKIMFSKHLLPTIIIFSPYFCSLIDKLTFTALTFLYGSPFGKIPTFCRSNKISFVQMHKLSDLHGQLMNWLNIHEFHSQNETIW